MTLFCYGADQFLFLFECETEELMQKEYFAYNFRKKRAKLYRINELYKFVCATLKQHTHTVKMLNQQQKEKYAKDKKGNKTFRQLFPDTSI